MRRRGGRGLADEPVALNDTFFTRTAPAPLASGHPLRGNRCASCGTLIGGQICQIVSLVVASGPMCSCGQIPNVTQLVCQFCSFNTDEWLSSALARYTEKVHGPGGHQ